MNNPSNLIINEIKHLIVNKNISEIINLEKDNIYNKSAVSLLVKKYINEHCLYNLDVIKDYNIKLKFIPVDQKYNCYEAMSFPNYSLCNILFEEWDSNDPFETSSLKKDLNFHFLFIPIIKIRRNGVFNNFMEWKIGDLSFWKPNDESLSLIRKEWIGVKNTIQSGVIVNQTKFGNSYRNTNNLPKQSETKSIHLRPHGKDGRDYDTKFLEYTNGAVEISKQSFWLNKKYINQILNEYKWKMDLKEG
jgi:DNA mismatch repair protein MutH